MYPQVGQMGPGNRLICGMALAAAIVAAALDRELKLSPVTGVDFPHAKGVVGMVGAVQVACCNAKFLAEHGIDVQNLTTAAEVVRAKAAMVSSVGLNGKLAGFVGIAEPIKESTAQAIMALRAEDILVVMLTGDGKTTADAVAREVGIYEVVADVLPQGKGLVIQRLKAQGRIVAMAGDGVNVGCELRLLMRCG